MTLWLAFALMTAAAIFAVLWPLSRRGAAAGGSDIAVYRDQLDEIARDRASGLIGEAEADAAKVEVSRRLIAAADAAQADKSAADRSPLWRRRATALTGLLFLPVGAAAIYLALGSPQMAERPLATQGRTLLQDNSIQNLVSQVEAHLARNPDDARGYEVIAPVYLRLGRFTDAVNARRRLLALTGETAERQADLGEALAAAANGVITVEAKAAFDRALTLDPAELKSKYYIGIAAEQDGDNTKAAAIWIDMLKAGPPDAPWVPVVREALTRIGAAPPVAALPPMAQTPGPNAADIAAAGGMSEKDRGDMIRGMVARLAEKLKEDGRDFDGWQRLLRAYVVLGERDKTNAAAADARKALASEPDKLRQLGDLIKSMGLEG